jgi:hypothetical protein
VTEFSVWAYNPYIGLHVLVPLDEFPDSPNLARSILSANGDIAIGKTRN